MISQSFSIQIPGGPRNLPLVSLKQLCAKKQNVWHLQLLHPMTLNCLILLCLQIIRTAVQKSKWEKYTRVGHPMLNNYVELGYD